MPTFTIFTGVNGVGKSTLYNFLKSIGNSDLGVRICPDEILEANNGNWKSHCDLFTSGQITIEKINYCISNKISFNWLSTAYLSSKGYGGHSPYRDSVNSIKIVGDKLIFKVTRKKINSEEIKCNLNFNPRFIKEYNSDDFEKYNRNTDYEIVVEYISNQFRATAIFQPLPSDNIQN